MPLNRDISDLLSLHAKRTGEDILTTLPAKVLRYHAARQTVDVEFAVRRPVVVQDDEVEWETLPNLTEVPVAWHGGGGYFVAIGLQAGDAVMIHGTAASMNQWLFSGVVPSDGPETRLHGLGSVWATPGGRDLRHTFADAPTSGVTIGKDADDAQIHFDAGVITLGKGATDSVALASKVDACMTAIATHVHPGVLSGPSSTGPSASLGSLPATGSSLIKAK